MNGLTKKAHKLKCLKIREKAKKQEGIAVVVMK